MQSFNGGSCVNNQRGVFVNAVILAGGFGSRLKPLTDNLPKPMLPLANVPMLDYVVSHLYSSGIKHAVLTLGYRPECISEWAKGYSGIKVDCITEDIPLGTAGGVRAACDLLDEHFIVVSGDALENVDYESMLSCHIKSGKLITIAVTAVDDPRQFGVVEYDDCGTVTSFIEKPKEFTDNCVVNCGIYIISRAALKFIPHGVKFDFARDLFPVLTDAKQINVYRHNGYWSDIGSPISYYKANFAMAEGGFYPLIHNRFGTISQKIRGNVIACSALKAGRCFNSIVGDSAAVASDANIEDCIVLPHTTVRGYHYREIIVDGYCMPIASVGDNLHDSTQIYKNFS